MCGSDQRTGQNFWIVYGEMSDICTDGLPGRAFRHAGALPFRFPCDPDEGSRRRGPAPSPSLRLSFCRFFSPSGSSASFSFTSAQEPQQPQHSPHHPPSALLLCGKYLFVSAIFSKIIPPIPTFALRLRRAHCRIRLSGGRHCLCPSAAGTVGGAVCSRGESLT